MPGVLHDSCEARAVRRSLHRRFSKSDRLFDLSCGLPLRGHAAAGTSWLCLRSRSANPTNMMPKAIE